MINIDLYRYIYNSIISHMYVYPPKVKGHAHMDFFVEYHPVGGQGGFIVPRGKLDQPA